MRWFDTLQVRLRSLVLRRHIERELDAELRFHLDQQTEENLRTGMSPEAARVAALRSTGSVTLIKEQCRESLGLRLLDELRQDVRDARRSFRRNPGFTVVAVATLALGIGANTAIFSLVDALLLRSLPVRDPQQLVTLLKVQGAQSGGSFSYPQVQRLAEHQELFAGLCGYAADTFSVGLPTALEPTGGAWVSGGYYQTLGLEPVAGRLLTPDDNRTGAGAVAVITDSYWARKFGRSLGTVGQSLLVEGVPVAIVGVSPSGFSGAAVGEPADLTLPLSALPRLQPERAFMVGTGGRWLRILARPREGLSRDRLKAGLNVVWTQGVTASLSPTATADARRQVLSSWLDLRSGATGTSSFRRQFREPLLLLMAVVGLVLVIACANVANLLLARAAARQREIAVRLATGAGRRRIVRQLLTESALLAGVGAAIGVTFASLGGGVLVTLISAGPAVLDGSLGLVLDLAPNWHVLTFTTLVAVSTTLLFGLAPAWRATAGAPNPATTIHAHSTRTTGPRGRLGSTLVIVQVSISLLLLIAAGLFIRTLQNLRTFDPGFHHEGVLLVDLDARRAGYQGTRLKTFNQEALAAAEQLPGVTAASLSSVTPLLGGGISLSVAVNGKPTDDGISGGGEMHINFVGPRYFETLRTPLALGREFTARDDAAAPGVAIVNEAFVRQHLPSGDPLAQHVSLVGRSHGDLQVVGVVKDAVYETLRQTPPPTVYAPYAQFGDGPVTLEIHAADSVAQVASVLRTALQTKLPATTPPKIRTLTAQLERGLVQERLVATIAGAFGALALVLAGVGLYGLLAYTVARRTNEIGVRLALGAGRPQVLRLVMADAVRLLAVGAACGLAAAWAASRVVSSMLFGITETNPVTTAGATVLLVLTGLLAGYLPARRAAGIDPIVALRCD